MADVRILTFYLFWNMFKMILMFVYLLVFGHDEVLLCDTCLDLYCSYFYVFLWGTFYKSSDLVNCIFTISPLRVSLKHYMCFLSPLLCFLIIWEKHADEHLQGCACLFARNDSCKKKMYCLELLLGFSDIIHMPKSHPTQ